MSEPRYETRSFQIYHGLNQYQNALSIFWWTVISQQRINYASETTSTGKSKMGVFFKDRASHDGTSSTKHLYYTEITAKRRIGSVPSAVAVIEDAFFEQLHAFVTPWINAIVFIKLAFFSFVGTWFVLAFFFAAKSTDMLYLSVIPPIWMLAFLAMKLWKSYIYKTQTYPALLEQHMRIVRENPIA
jgi:hypothetical protein